MCDEDAIIIPFPVEPNKTDPHICPCCRMLHVSALSEYCPTCRRPWPYGFGMGEEGFCPSPG